MQEVLTAPLGGYYTEATATDDRANTSAADVGVFGKRGDFVTAPEISQLFGELLGLWCISLWQSAGSPERVQLVELGPGRGKMMSDILRAAKHFPAFNTALSVGMVEASPTLIRSQAELLAVTELSEYDASTKAAAGTPTPTHAEAKEGVGEEAGWVAEGVTSSGVPVQWYRHFGTAVPPPSATKEEEEEEEEEPFLIVLANEYWDALPARQFQLTERGWCEVCIDVADKEEEAEVGTGEASPYHLKWALSPNESPAVAAYVPFVLEGERQRLLELGQASSGAGAAAAGKTGPAAAAAGAAAPLPSPESTVPGSDPTEDAGAGDASFAMPCDHFLTQGKLKKRCVCRRRSERCCGARQVGGADEAKTRRRAARGAKQHIYINEHSTKTGSGQT
jgi:NADH dehydrogenase [ubiquinone] 1 alpha subcomplex assembly factor 7